MSSPDNTPADGHVDGRASSSMSREERRDWRAFATRVLVVLILAAGLRLYGLGEPDYWLDELHSLANSAARRDEFDKPRLGTIFQFTPNTTVLTAESTWPAVWRKMENDSHPPTYFLLLLSWRRLVGDGEYAVRLLPTFFSILSLVPIALILREFRRPTLGVVVAALLAVAFSHIRYAQNNRPYSLALLLLGLSFWAFARMYVGWDRLGRRERWKWSVGYGLATYLSVMTHYFTGAALLAQAVLALTRRRGGFRRAWCISVAAAVLVFAVTWGSKLIEQWSFIANQDWLRMWEPDHTVRTLLRAADLPIRLLFWHEPLTPTYAGSIAGAALLIFALTALRGRNDVAAKIFAAWYLMPVLMFTAIDLLSDMRLLVHLRYISIATPGLVGLIAIAAYRMRGMWRWSAIAAAGLAMTLTLHLPVVVNPRARRAAYYIAQQWRPGDLLVFDAIGWPPFSSLQTYQVAAYYLPEYTPAKPRVVLIEEPIDENLRREISAFNRLIIVSPRVGDDVNPVPELFHEINKTGHVRMMGEVRLLEKRHGWDY